MRSVEEHQRVVADLIAARPAATVGLGEADGLVFAADVVATLPLPVFDNSAMDGYAVYAGDVKTASAEAPVTLPVAEDIPAGRTDLPDAGPGTAHRIMTGAPVPARADAVVPVEATDAGTDVVVITAARSRASTSVGPARTSAPARPCCRPAKSSHPPRWACWPHWDWLDSRRFHASACW